MAIVVNLYTFAKKVNSTGRPASSPLSVDCVLKDSCSIIYPVIGLDKGLTWNPAAYNYAYISAFNRYYYVNDWSFAEGLWWASLGVDALASWKDEILSDSAYILRSTDHWDGAIIDGMYPAKSTYKYQRSTWQGVSPWSYFLTDGFYSVGIINSDASSMGAVSYYAFSSSEFATLKSFLLSDVTWTGILQTNPDIGENLYKSLFNPFQYITSVQWFPFAFPSDHGTAVSSIKIGWWEVPQIPCKRITDFRHEITGTLSAYAHSLFEERGAFVNGAPYSKYRLVAPPFGEFELEASYFAMANFSGGVLPSQNTTPLVITIIVDLMTGTAALSASLSNTGAERAPSLLLTQTTLAIPIQLAQISSAVTAESTMSILEQSVTSLAKGVIGAITGSGDTSGSGRFSVEGILDAIAVGENRMAQMGSNGSLAQFTIAFFLDSIHYDLVDANWVENGQPVCEYRDLIDFSGEFVLTEKADIVIPATEQEITAVNDALNRGIYLT